MLELDIIIFILLGVLSFMAEFIHDLEERPKLSIIGKLIVFAIVFAYCVAQITMQWTVFTIPKILLLLAIYIVVVIFFRKLFS